MDFFKKIGQFFGINSEDKEEEETVEKKTTIISPTSPTKIQKKESVKQQPISGKSAFLSGVSKGVRSLGVPMLPEKSETRKIIAAIPSAIKGIAEEEFEKGKQRSALPAGEQFKEVFMKSPAKIMGGIVGGFSNVGKSVLEEVYGKEKVGEVYAPESKTAQVQKKLFGYEPESWQKMTHAAQDYLDKSPDATSFEKKWLAPLIGIAGFMSDVTGFGGGKGKISKEIFEQIAKETDEKIIRELALKSGIPNEIIERSASKLVTAKTPDEVRNVLVGEGETFMREVAETAPKAAGPDLEVIKSASEHFDKGNLNEADLAHTLKSQFPNEDPVVIENFASGMIGMRENGQSIAGVIERNFIDDGMTEVGKLETPQPSLPIRSEPKIQALPETVAPTTDQVKQRGFIDSVLESENIPSETKKLVEKLPEYQRNYGVFTNVEAVKIARDRIGKDKDEALSHVLSSTNLDKETVTTGLEFMRQYRLAGNHEMEARIAGHLAEQATKSGQAVQAFSLLNKLSPDGVLVFASKRIGQPIAPPLAKKLTDKAKIIQDLPHGYEKHKQTQELIDIISNEVPRSTGKKTLDFIGELANMPRTIMASADLSFGLRQGAVAGARNPKEWGEAFVAQLKAAKTEEGYEQVMDGVFKHPDFELAQKFGISFSDVNQKLLGREERYMSSLAEKIPGIGTIIRKSNRAYTAMANKLRMDTFSKLANNAKDLGLDLDDKVGQQIANFVNDATGRGTMNKAFEGAAPLFNAIFFSPRLISSRLNLLNPVRYVTAEPFVRKEALKTMATYGTFVTTVLGLASTIPGVDVGTDPRSADFGKIKTGNTRIDVAAGFQQYFRIAAQLITGKYISSSTGRVITLGEGYKPLTRYDILVRGLESKEAPIFSLITTLLKGQDIEGNKINVPKEVGSRFVPMIVSDLYDLATQSPELLPLGFLSLFGIGTQTYGAPEAYEKVNEIDNSEDPSAAFEKLKEENPILAEKVKKAKIEQSFTEFDWGLTYMKVENGQRAKFLNEHFKSLPTDADRSKQWNDLRKKKLISDQVSEQIKYLMNSEN